MQKRLVLTSLVAFWCVCPIFAARGESFPTDGLMLEYKTYEKAATYDNMGKYEGTVTAKAKYEDVLYQIEAGTYLPAGSEYVDQCPANSYCPGMTDVLYNESAVQGVWSCPDGYPNSAAGASTETQCYTACTVDSANIANATAVSGNDYFGAGVDTCAATACKNGYHVEGTMQVVDQTPLIDVDYTVGGNGTGFINFTGSETSNANTYGLTENNTWAAEFDYGVVYGRASCRATIHDPGIEYIFANEGAVWDGEISLDQFRSELTAIVGAPKANYYADALAVAVSDGGWEALDKAFAVVFGSSKDASYNTTDTGQHCYCQMTGFREADSSSVVNIASAPWKFNYDTGSADECADICAGECGFIMMDYDLFRGAMLGALDFAASGTCAANEITINWTGATDAAIAENNAGMCTYDGEIRTPKSAITIPGKTFVGWKFNKN